MNIKDPVLIKVFGMATSDGDILCPFNFPNGFRFNTVAYIKCLEEVVLLWNERVTAGKTYVWQQDPAPCHTSIEIFYITWALSYR